MCIRDSNAAFAGMGLPTIDQDIRNRIRRMHPTLVFAYPTPAQYLEDEPPVPARPDSSATQGKPSALKMFRPRVAERSREQLKQLLPRWIQTRIRGFQRE